MKKIILTSLFTIFISTSVFADVLFQTTGFGAGGSVTNTPVEITGFTANLLSVYNTGSKTLFCLVNTTTAGMTAAMSAKTAVPVISGGAFTFNTYGKTSLNNIFLCTSNAAETATYYMGAY